MAFPRATTLAHQLITERLSEGDFAIDATAGNGHDTKFLAKTVGSTGRVLAIDIQEEAIASAKRRCSDYLEMIDFRVADHADLGCLIEGQAMAAMFNLGYLPSGDKAIITRPESTLSAIQQTLARLQKNGILTIAVYHGHSGGEDEATKVLQFVSDLDQTEFTAIKYEFLNQENSPPFLIAIERR